MGATANISEAFAAIVGGLLAVITLRATVYAELIVYVPAVVISFTLVEPPRTTLKHPQGRLMTLVRIVRDTLWHDRVLAWTIAQSVLLGLSSMVIVWFVQPYLKNAGLSVVWFGMVWAGLNGLTAIGSMCSARLTAGVPKYRFMGYMGIGVVISYLALASGWSSVVIAGCLAACFLRGVRNPVFSNYINERTTSDQRATVLSIHAMMFRLGFAALSPFLGSFAAAYTPSGLFALCAVAFAIALTGTLVALYRSENCD